MSMKQADAMVSPGRKSGGRIALALLSLLPIAAGLSSFLVLAACSGGGGGSSRFTLISTNGLENNSIWQINRPIELTFSQPVDLSTANLNSVQIFEVAGSIPAVGTFYLKPGSEGKTLVFQPLCPTNNAFDNGGLKPRGTLYRLSLPTSSARSSSLLNSQGGESLSLGITREFSTPLSEQEFFLDPKPQAAPLVTKIFLGSRQVFPDPTTGGPPQTAIDIGLNSFSDPNDAIVVLFDQPLQPSSQNISTRNLQIYFEDTSGPGTVEVQVPLIVTLVENCGIDGSTILLSPQGILPPGAELHLRVKRELQDIVGETNLADIEPLRFKVVTPQGTESDAFSEDFDDTTYFDEEAVFPEPRASWGAGELQPAVPFEGSNLDFDWVVDGVRIIDTDFDTITNQAGTQTIPVANGVVDIHSLHITANGELRAQGSNPLVLLCSGDVTVDGLLAVSGANAQNVNTVCTTAIPEEGAPGLCGGGSGGTGSWETTTSTRQGGPGNGAFELLGAGGEGGEASVSPSLPNQRAAGGGGGTWREGSCVSSPPAARSIEGRCGIDGHPNSVNASGSSPAKGGLAGPTIFRDGDTRNDFFGIGIDQGTGEVFFGELTMAQGGQGGGGGGDSVQWSSYPSPRWNSSNFSAQDCDLKGAGAGAGAGVLIIKSLGRITVSGSIEAVGGSGGSGENKGGTNTVAGGSGAGAGGHIILMSTNQIDLRNATVDARGGTGGRGQNRTPYPTISAGGHGGSGVIQYHVPNPATNLIFNGATPPGDPTPVILIPDFGAISVAQTRWITTGFSNPGSATIPSPPFYWFEGTETSGPNAGLVERNTATSTVDPPARHFQTHRVPRDNFGPNTITLPTEVAEVTNPALMIDWEVGDEIAVNSGLSTPFFTITSAQYVNGETVITTDPADGDLTQLFTFEPDPANPQSTLAIVGLYPRYFRIFTDGVENSYPPSVGVFITFQGADAEAGDPSKPDLATLAPNPSNLNEWAADVDAINDRQFFRVRFTFNLDFDLSGLSANSPKASIDFFKLPFKF